MSFKIAYLFIFLNSCWFLKNSECHLPRRSNQPNHFIDPCSSLRCKPEEICIANTATDADCIPTSSISVFSDTHFIHKRNVICEEGNCKTFKQVEFTDPCAHLQCNSEAICIVIDSDNAECMPISSLTFSSDSYFLRRRRNALPKKASRRVFTSQITHKFESPCLDACRHGECEILNMTSHSCHCVKGVTGKNCNYLSIDSNPCLANPCFGESACINLSNNKFVCICRSGRAGPTCQGHVAPCQCMNDGACRLADLDVFTCDCPIGYGGHLCQFELMKEITEVSDLNSTQTEDFNKSTEPNTTNISREKNESEVVSDLKESYEPVQTVYVHTNTCASNTCLNGGTCLQVNPSLALCLCPSKFRGAYCRSTSPEKNDLKNVKTTTKEITFLENEVSCPEPLQNVCLNGGTCLRKTNSTMFKCVCQSGFTGTFCDQKEPFCNDLYKCRNGGTCYQTDSLNGKCACMAAFKGLNCEIGLECPQNPCSHSQPCITIHGVPKCVCIDGYTGPNCP